MRGPSSFPDLRGFWQSRGVRVPLTEVPPNARPSRPHPVVCPMSERPSPGGHELPPLLHSPATPRRSRRALIWWVSASLTLAAILATAGALQLMANLGYDDAMSRFDDTLADNRLTLADVEALTDELR